ncbi:LytR/AlgR family response regulator transcription factor [Arachidicoccus terrestris]|uniref:LytR/AlgR family response regulator transcription factor n=1 Tax=Arachidicoccus terrestris TaxID=2875539 RepID=UPI001CC78325|nr:LytTR family DNA-binding domain-containing protein [Arachidicoccus terrestris]UAY57126.1 LytTR family DNA-binding domain-containing protein [Arachidicoccus terrestris]
MSKPLSFVIVDDEFQAIELLGDYVIKTPGTELLLKTTSALEALDFIQENQVDVLLLDIQMPEITGLELIDIIKNRNTKVILTTAYSEFAVDGFNQDVIDFLLKPITFERFLTSISKAKKRINIDSSISGASIETNLDYIFIKTEYRLKKIILSTVLYIEGLGDYITLYTTEGKTLSLERIKYMEEILPSCFLRIHKSYIININSIDFIEKNRIIIGKEYLPIGASFKEKVRIKLKL